MSELTPRELECLQLASHGLKNDAIAHQLGIAVETVKRHLSSAFYKLQANNRAHAVAMGLRGGWLE